MMPASGSRIRGLGTGVVVLAVAGLTWFVPAAFRFSSNVSGDLAAIVTGVAVVVVVALGSGGLAMRRAPSTDTSPSPHIISRRFGWVVGAEGAGILLAGCLLGATDHSDLIPAFVCAVVGLHFVPLARMFAVRVYFWTAVALCSVSVATFVVVGASNAPAWLWQVLPGFGAAACLWATAATLIAADA